MKWFRFGSGGGKKKDDRRLGERRQDEEPEVPFWKKLLRFIGATVFSVTWTLMWLLVTLGLVCVLIAGSYFAFPGTLEQGLLWVSRLLSDVIYAVDIRTGWFTNDLPKMLEMGVMNYLTNLPTMIYVKFWAMVGLSFFVFVLITYVKSLRRYASIFAGAFLCAIFYGYYTTIEQIEEPDRKSVV